MTDHADTIRAAIENDYTTVGAKLGHDALDALLAERQQAQDKLWEQSEAAANLVKEVERLVAERQQLQEEIELLKERAERASDERQQAQEERDAAFDAVGLPRTASLDDLIRHHRNNAGMAASGHKIAAEEWEKRAVKAEAERQQAQLKYENLVAAFNARGAERQQAIDALREAHNRLLVIECDARYEDGNIEQAQKIEALLVKLGEKP